MGAFSLGRVVATPGALEMIGWAGAYALLTRHVGKDWGDLEAFDRRQNEIALETGERILSAYQTPSAKVYVITEWDRSSTCVLLASEY